MTLRHRLLACAGAALLLCATAFTASADDTMTVSVEVTQATGDTFTASFLGAAFNPIEVSAVGANRSDGYVQMVVEDRRGTDAAWDVQFTIGDFTGDSTGGAIAASNMTDQYAYVQDYHNNFAAPDYYDPLLQTFDAATGAWSATGDQTGGYLTYWQGALIVPSDTAADSYVSTLTLDVISAP